MCTDSSKMEYDPQLAISIKAHLSVLQSRVTALQNELLSALKVSGETKAEIEKFTVRWQTLEGEAKQNREEIEAHYGTKIHEYERQIKLANGMLEKKCEEREALLGYLRDSNIIERFTDDLVDFDWQTLIKMAMSTTKSELLEEKSEQASVLVDLNQKTRTRYVEIYDQFASIVATKNKTREKLEELDGYISGWREFVGVQNNRIARMQADYERLHLLIKQCATASEPMSEFVTRNVREKCHSFLDSSSPEELLVGLQRYHLRQERMIKLLKHKENRLANDTNQLQIAKEETSDNLQYYLNIIQRETVVNSEIN